MAKETVSLDDFLKEQDTAESAFWATLERVDADDTKVKLTPWATSGGCLCALSFTVPKTAISGLTKTERVHSCCGKNSPVVEVEFADSHGHVSDIMGQLTRNAHSALAYHDNPDDQDGPHEPQDCDSKIKRCRDYCQILYPHDSEARIRCHVGCDKVCDDDGETSRYRATRRLRSRLRG